MFILSALLPLVLASVSVQAGPWGPRIKNVVTFGDSYTDSTEWIATNGTTWPEYLASYAHLKLYPYAISGATCDNKSTPRIYPDVVNNELGTYFNQTKNHTAPLRLDPAETLYTLWIGTNDVGAGELLTGQSTPGVSIVTVSACAVSWIKTLYESGARNFLFQNMIPLQDTPIYSVKSWPNRYWDEQRNTTEWNIFITELVAAGNALTKYMINELQPSIPSATIGYFDSFSLFKDIYNHPSKYLNGTAPLNVTGAVSTCVYALNESLTDIPADCVIVKGTDKDSYMWVDELHPSEQTDRVLAREIASLINGSSTRWTTWYH